MKRFFYGNITQNGTDLPTITGSGDFTPTIEQAAIETAPEVFENIPGRFFLRSDGNFVDGQCGLIMQPSIGGQSFVNGIFTEIGADAPDRIGFVTTNSSGIPADDVMRNTSFIAWTDVEVES